MWSAWAINPSQSTGTNWSAYRAKVENGMYGEYEQRTHSKEAFYDSDQLLAFLNILSLPLSNPDCNFSATQGNPFRGPGANPFLNQGASRRSATPLPSNRSRSDNPYSSNPSYLPTTQLRIEYGRPYVGLSKRTSTTPGPEKIRRSANKDTDGCRFPVNPFVNPYASPRDVPAAPSDHTRSRPITRNFKIVKPEDQRRFFKAGRIFKAYWKDEASGSNNPFGEVLRFLVVKPFNSYSTCLTIHTYQNQATSRQRVRSGDHVFIYLELPDNMLSSRLPVQSDSDARLTAGTLELLLNASNTASVDDPGGDSPRTIQDIPQWQYDTHTRIHIPPKLALTVFFLCFVLPVAALDPRVVFVHYQEPLQYISGGAFITSGITVSVLQFFPSVSIGWTVPFLVIWAIAMILYVGSYLTYHPRWRAHLGAMVVAHVGLGIALGQLGWGGFFKGGPILAPVTIWGWLQST